MRAGFADGRSRDDRGSRLNELDSSRFNRLNGRRNLGRGRCHRGRNCQAGSLLPLAFHRPVDPLAGALAGWIDPQGLLEILEAFSRAAGSGQYQPGFL
jgi:hypothetical protein